MRAPIILLFLLLAALTTVGVDGQNEPGPEIQKEDFTIETDDGVTLAATVYRPSTPGPHPAILLTHGWPEWRGIQHVTLRAERWAGQGYLVVAYDSRGFGESTGETTLDGPAEVKDAQRFIDWIAGQPDVQLEGPGDPVVGFFGRSYAGGIAQLTTMIDPRVDVLATEITWNDLYFALVPNDVVKVGWINLLFHSGQAETHGIPINSRDPNNLDPDAQGGASPKLTEWYTTTMATNEASPELRTELGVVRSVDTDAIRVPSLHIQGFNDTLFDARHAAKSFTALREQGVAAKMILYAGGHGVNFAWDSPQHVEIEKRLDAWFDLHLREDATAQWVADWPVEHWNYMEKRFQGEAAWPPLRVAPAFYYLSGTEDAAYAGNGKLVTSPPQDGEIVRLVQAAAPSNYVEVPNFQDEDPDQEHHSPGTSVTFATEPLENATEMLGAPIAYLSLTREAPRGEIIIMVRIVDIAPEGTFETIHKQVTPVRVELPDGATPATFVPIELAPLSHVFNAGHSIGLAITTSDPAFGSSREANTVGIGTTATSPSFVSIPFVLPGVAADPLAPSVLIERLPSTLKLGVNHTFEIVTSDNLRVANLTIEVANEGAVERSETVARPPETVGTWLNAKALGNYTVRVLATDVAGQQSEAVRLVKVVSAEPTTSDEARPKDNNTPTIGPAAAFLGLAVLAWIRRRHG